DVLVLVGESVQVAVVGCYPHGELPEIVRVWNPSADQRGVFQLKLILIIGSQLRCFLRVAFWRVNGGELDTGHIAVSIQGIRASIALAVDDIHPPAIGTEGYIGWVVCGRQKSDGSVSKRTAQRD